MHVPRLRLTPLALDGLSLFYPSASTMSYFLVHLQSGWHVDQAILSEEDRVVVIRFGHDHDPTCMQMDETLYGIAERVKNFAVIYVVDITQVPDFNKMYELYDPCSLMFFYRNKHIMIDLGTGNNNKINWAIENKQELIDICEVVYRGASKGRGLVISPKGECLFRSANEGGFADFWVGLQITQHGIAIEAICQEANTALYGG